MLVDWVAGSVAAPREYTHPVCLFRLESVFVGNLVVDDGECGGETGSHDAGVELRVKQVSQRGFEVAGVVVADGDDDGVGGGEQPRAGVLQ